jgi:branched-subunit amino acid transport protein
MAGLAHPGFGFAAKRIAPKVPVGFLLFGSWVLDLFAIVFPLVGIDANGSMPYWTHSLFMAAVWSLATAGITALITRSFRASLALGLVVLSHWVMDFISWPMSSIYPNITSGVPLFIKGSPNVGLGLYQTIPGVVIGECISVLGGVVLYVTRLIKYKKDKKAAAAADKVAP